MKLYDSTTTVAQWYGSSVVVPRISNSAKFIPFATSCVGIATTMLEKKTDRALRVGLSGSIATAYADPDKNLVVISRKFLSGDFSAIGADKELSGSKTIGAILGIIVHEIAHFAYSPKDLRCYMDYIQQKTTRQYDPALAKRVANTLEDIYIENRVAKILPTLSWSLDEINRIMLTESVYKESIKILAKVGDAKTDIARNHVLNFLLFAKVTDQSGKVSPFVRELFRLARSVCKLDNLIDRFALALRIYEIIAPEKNAPKPSQNNGSGDSDPDDSTEPDDSGDDSGDGDDSEDDTDDTEDAKTGDSGDSESDDTEDDTEPESSDSNASGDASDSEDTEDTEDDYSDASGDSESEDNSATTEDTEPDDFGNPTDDQRSESEQSEPEQSTVELPEPRELSVIDAYTDESPEPFFDEIDRDASPTMARKSLDGHKIFDVVMATDAPTGIEMDKRYTRLSQVAQQRATTNRAFGEQKTKGRNMHRIYRAAIDQKIFADKLPTNAIQPSEIIILLDCSGSMAKYTLNGAPTLLEMASAATLGAATGLINGKCIVSVYGHSADKNCTTYQYDTKTINLYALLRNGESLPLLSKRLATLNRYAWRYCYCNRDGYALYEISKRFTQSNRQKTIIVISDGQPNGDGNDYYGYSAIEHTRNMVATIRASGIKVYSLSIDTEAYTANNYIYGSENNVCSTDPNAIDQMIRDLFLK